MDDTVLETSGLLNTVFARSLKVRGSQNIDSTSAAASATKQSKKYQLDPNSQQTELKMASMNLKFVSLNLFSKKLVSIDLSENKIRSLPEEFVTIAPLQLLKIDNNLGPFLSRSFRHKYKSQYFLFRRQEDKHDEKFLSFQCQPKNRRGNLLKSFIIWSSLLNFLYESR